MTFFYKFKLPLATSILDELKNQATLLSYAQATTFIYLHTTRTISTKRLARRRRTQRIKLLTS